MHKLICGDVLDVLPTLGRFKCLIMDPPDNIGLGYGEYNDNLPELKYTEWLGLVVSTAVKHADIVWVSFNAKWMIRLCAIMDQALYLADHFKNYEARIFVQSFTFGQNNKYDCGNGFRPLLRLKHRDVKLYPEAIRVPSWRQLNGDKRAAVGGRVPLDHWEFPRVTGNSKQRRNYHPTQLHEGMIERIIKFSTQPGDAICDCFSGTGTVLRAVRNLSGNYPFDPARNSVTSIELDSGYCEKIAAEHGLSYDPMRHWYTNGGLAA